MMTPGRTWARVLLHICTVTRGSSLVVLDCRADIGRSPELSEETLWDAIDALLAEGVIEPAQESGIRVRLTVDGAEWYRTLPRRLHMLRRIMEGKEAGSVSTTECRVAAVRG
jgi:hypothetical protein